MKQVVLLACALALVAVSAGAQGSGIRFSRREIAASTPGPELVTIDAACTGWTLGANWACGGDGTIRHNAGVSAVPPNGARYNVAAVPGTTYEIVVTASHGVYAGIPSSRPFLVQIGDSPSGFVFSDGAHTFRRTALLATAVTLGTEANGTTIEGNFAVSVKAIIGGGVTVGGTTTFNGPVNVEGALSFPGGVSLETNSSGLSMYLGRMVAKSRDADLFGNLCLGGMSCYSVTSGGDNTCLGTNTCSGTTTGGYNTVVGVDAAMRLADSQSNTLIGKTAGWGLGQTTAANENVGIGNGALYGTSANGATKNTAAGFFAGYGVTSASTNTLLGWYAGAGVTSGCYHTFVGAEAGYKTGASPATANAVTTSCAGGGPNTFIGYRAGQGAATQLYNATALGQGAYVGSHNYAVVGNGSLAALMAGSTGRAVVESGLERGAHVKTLTDGAAAATVAQVPLTYDNYQGGLVQWSAESTDATDYRQAQGLLMINAIKKGSTTTCGVDIVSLKVAGDALHVTSNANVAACTWTFVSNTTLCDLMAACTDDTAGTQTITVRVKPLQTTITNGLEWVWP